MRSFLYKRLKSMQYACSGLVDLYKNHPNAQVHALATIAVLLLAYYLEVSYTELYILLLCIALVTSLEAMNSAVEYLANFCSKDQHILLKKCKDIAAAAVFFASIIAAVIGSCIFLPKIYSLL